MLLVVVWSMFKTREGRHVTNPGKRANKRGRSAFGVADSFCVARDVACQCSHAAPPAISLCRTA